MLAHGIFYVIFSILVCGIWLKLSTRDNSIGHTGKGETNPSVSTLNVFISLEGTSAAYLVY